MESDSRNNTLIWAQTVRWISQTGRECNSRGLLVKEWISHSLDFDMNYPIINHLQRKLNLDFMLAEAMWILSGGSMLKDIAPWCKKMETYSDDGIYMSGAYGPMFVSQVRYVVDTLKSDLDSRQAVMTVWRQNPRPSKDIPCTVSLQFLVRNNEINCIVYMRSSDAWLGLPYDIFTFSMMANFIASLVPGVANMGRLTVFAGSRHVYEEHWNSAKILEIDSKQFGDAESVVLFKSPTDLMNYLGDNMGINRGTK
jgi:thymidylate synthase